MTAQPSTPDPRPRRRGEELETAILDAAWEVLTEVGYAKITIEAVAARAGTSKPVIYRRWPNRAALMFAARVHRTPRVPRPRDTGSLRGDLLAWIGATMHRHEGTTRDVIAGLVADAFRDPEVFAELRAQLRKSALAAQVRIIAERAEARGEIPTADLPERVLRLPVDLLRNETILYGREITGEVLEGIVDEVVIPVLTAPRP
jgi:AcrR family transcriptional regulator